MAVLLRRWGRCPSRSRSGPWWWRSSGASVSAVVVDAGADARADRGLDAHRRLLVKRWISRRGPSRTPGRRAPRCGCPSPPHPLGSMPGPEPARSVVVVCMVPSAVVVDARAHSRADRGPDAHRFVPFACGVDLSRWGPPWSPGRRGSWCWRAWRRQPLSSIRGPAPARMRVWLLIVGLRSAVGVDGPAGAGADLRARLHCQVPFIRSGRCLRLRRRRRGWRCSSSRSFSRTGRWMSRRRIWSGCWCAWRCSFQPLGSIPQPTLAWTRVLVFIVRSSAQGVDEGAVACADRRGDGHGLLLSPRGRCSRRCRRGAWWSHSWFFSFRWFGPPPASTHGTMSWPRRARAWRSAFRVDAGPGACAYRRGRDHGLLLSPRGRWWSGSRRAAWSWCSWGSPMGGVGVERTRKCCLSNELNERGRGVVPSLGPGAAGEDGACSGGMSGRRGGRV